MAGQILLNFSSGMCTESKLRLEMKKGGKNIIFFSSLEKKEAFLFGTTLASSSPLGQ